MIITSYKSPSPRQTQIESPTPGQRKASKSLGGGEQSMWYLTYINARNELEICISVVASISWKNHPNRSTLCRSWVVFLLGQILVDFHLKFGTLEHIQRSIEPITLLWVWLLTKDTSVSLSHRKSHKAAYLSNSQSKSGPGQNEGKVLQDLGDSYLETAMLQ